MDEIKYLEHELKNFTKEEEAYRRGYRQGFFAARHTDVQLQDVLSWSYGDECVCPPGTPLAGIELNGLTKSEKLKILLDLL